MITALISSITLGISLLAGHLLASRVTHSNVYWPLALFFFVNALAQLCFIVREPIVIGGELTFLPELTLFKLWLELSLPPLAWIYFRELTSGYARGLRLSDAWHLTIPFIPGVLLVGIFYVATLSGSDFSLRAYILQLNGILNIAALGQFCVYVTFILRGLTQYRSKITNLFSSTENMELNWFRWALLMFGLVFLLEVSVEVIYIFYGVTNPHPELNNIVRLGLIWFMALWGLRQRPDLQIEIDKSGANPSAQKYEKSALPHEQLVGVAAKVRAAIEDEKGYKDPNLSLRTLSEQISVLPNYVSQGLNVEMKETFFDYVNRLRVLDAMNQLAESDDTVLNISSDVGFNSRSSFYTAFKKGVVRRVEK